MKRFFLLGMLVLVSCGTTAGVSTGPTATTLPQPTASFFPSTTPATPTTAPMSAPTATAIPTPQQAALAYILGADGVVQAWNPATGTAEERGQLPADASHIALAPDGSAVAFMLGNRVMTQEWGGQAHDITPTALAGQLLPLTTLHWSPDGQRLMFDADLGDGSVPQPMIYVAGRDDALAQEFDAGIGPAWSPDGSAVAFAGAPFEPASPYGGGPGGVLTLAQADGSGARSLGGVQVFPGYQSILWADDGAQIAAADAVVHVADGAVVARAPKQDRSVLGAITQFSAAGFGTWQSVRFTTPAQDDPFLFDEADMFTWVGADGSTATLRGAGATCPCMPLAQTAMVIWGAQGDTALVVGGLDADPEPALRVWHKDRTPQIIARWAVEELPAPAYWSPDGRSVLLGNNGTVWYVPLDGGAARQIGSGVALGWAAV